MVLASVIYLPLVLTALVLDVACAQPGVSSHGDRAAHSDHAAQDVVAAPDHGDHGTAADITHADACSDCAELGYTERAMFSFDNGETEEFFHDGSCTTFVDPVIATSATVR